MNRCNNHYHLIKNGVTVGQCVILSENNVAYHLFKDIRSTKFTTLKDIISRYELKEIPRIN